MRNKLCLLLTCLLLCGGSAFAAERASVLTLPLPQAPVKRLEQIYLHEFSATIMETSRDYALIAGRVPYLGIAELRRYERCQEVLTSIERRQEELLSITETDKIDSATYFSTLLSLSLTLAIINRDLSELGQERNELQKNFMGSLQENNEMQAKIKKLDDELEVLDGKMNDIFNDDPANLLLTVKVGRHKQHLYQKILADFYHLLSMNMAGTQLVEAVHKASQPLIDQAWEEVTGRHKQFLQMAWQHTCGKRRGWLQAEFAPLGFYIKHRKLVARVESLLQSEQEDKSLLETHKRAEQYFAKRITPEHFRSSAGSFFGTLATLTVPALIVPKKYNMFTIPVMGAAGLLNAGYRTKVLYNMRYQLETGALSGVNSFDLYHDFYSNTSLLSTAFSNLSVAALAILLRKIPKREKAAKFSKDGKLLPLIAFATSFATMFAAEAVQTKNINFLKDRDFLFNLFIVVTVDLTLPFIATMGLTNGQGIALAVAASTAYSVIGHLIAGKKINWDRIIFDTTYISVYSKLKAKYLYVGGTQKLVKHFDLDGKGKLAAASMMSLLNNIAGNGPYSFIARRWVERPNDHNKFPLPTGQSIEELSNTSLEQQLDNLFAYYGIEDELKQIILAQLLGEQH